VKYALLVEGQSQAGRRRHEMDRGQWVRIALQSVWNSEDHEVVSIAFVKQLLLEIDALEPGEDRDILLLKDLEEFGIISTVDTADIPGPQQSGSRSARRMPKEGLEP